MRIEITKSIDDVNLFMQLTDELICATKSYEILKKIFWAVRFILYF